jgi:hypothetical protein
VTASGWGNDLPKMEREAFDLDRLTLEVMTSDAHPDGECARVHMPCAGCGQLAPIAKKYGNPMADCRLCCYAWAVHHDPWMCWLRSSYFDSRPGGETALADQVSGLTPLLLAARALLDDVIDPL